MALKQGLEGIVNEPIKTKIEAFTKSEIINSIFFGNTPITDVFAADYDSLTETEKYVKAILLLQRVCEEYDSTKLEEAAIILDQLSHKAPTSQIYRALAYAHALDGRFIEANYVLEKGKVLGTGLERFLANKLKEERDTVSSLDYHPDTSYVAVYQENDQQIEKLLRETKKAEVVLVVDDLKYVANLKNKFKDSLYTIETESEIHEKYNPSTESRLRIVLKNNNNGIVEKGYQFGMQKSLNPDQCKIVKNDDLSSLEEVVKNTGQKIRVAFFCTTTENTHGVPVVMNNINSQLALNPQYEVSFITNSFDDNQINYTDSTGKKHTFRNREQFVQFLQEQGIKIDVVHAHSWHLSDYHKPFHTGKDSMDLSTFLKELGSPKFIYTNHSNPTEDLRKIQKFHGNLDYSQLSESEKRKFLQANCSDSFGSSYDWQPHWEATTILCKEQIMELADAITYVSATQMHEEEQMIPDYHYGHKAKVIMNGVDIGKYNVPETHARAAELREELGIDRNEKVVLYAGRMDEEKGIYELATASERLSEAGEKITLVYLGTNGDESIKQTIRAAAPDVNILFPGRISREERQKMAAMYALADVVAQPTWGECFNQIIAEALAMGTPAVVSDYSAPGEIYVKPGAALGSQVRNPEDLAEKLSLLLNEKSVRASITGKGKELIDHHLNVESMGRQYMGLYSALVRN